jgi:steroid 5-alpha reductase family enzyme
MNIVSIWLLGLPAVMILGLIAWIVASARRNVGLIDICWSLFFLVATLIFVAESPARVARAWLVVALVGAWALRLAVYLTIRNWSRPEDHRYRAIRARNEPGFVWKSLYLVFALQAALAWVISAPLAGAVIATTPLGPLDVIGATLALFGVAFESVADWQLACFKSDAANAAAAMDRGLWRFSRHPNYFGEFCVWWGFYFIAASAGAWWSIFSPLLMTLLLLKVSGVVLLEKDIAERRPAYRDYVARTNAFLPGCRH